MRTIMLEILDKIVYSSVFISFCILVVVSFFLVYFALYSENDVCEMNIKKPKKEKNGLECLCVFFLSENILTLFSFSSRKKIKSEYTSVSILFKHWIFPKFSMENLLERQKSDSNSKIRNPLSYTILFSLWLISLSQNIQAFYCILKLFWDLRVYLGDTSWHVN